MTTCADALDRAVQDRAAFLREARRHLHQFPEPSGSEFETAAWIAGVLERQGVPHRIVANGRGIIVEPAAASPPGPTVVVRADIDALRLSDGKDVAYRSRHANLMHACGHDAHTAMLLGATMALHDVQQREGLPVRWRCLFQPAEETGAGALEMIDEGALQNAVAILALHVDPTYEAGVIGVREGALTAFCDEWEILVVGQGGHGARPHLCRDPIAAAAQFLQALYATSREQDPATPGVVSAGIIEAGGNPNVIPDRCRLQGTLRSHRREHSLRLRERVERLCTGIGEATGTRLSYATIQALPGVMNDPAITHDFARAAAAVGQVVPVEQPSMGGEDFASYLEKVPGAMLRLGCGTPGVATRHLHTTGFDIDEDCLLVGARLLARAVLTVGTNRADVSPTEEARATDA